MNEDFMFTSSWDDGFPSDLRVADLLKKYDLQGTFFVPVVNKENRPVLKANEVAHLAASFEIGGHTFSHSYLRDKLSLEEIRTEIWNGKKVF